MRIVARFANCRYVGCLTVPIRTGGGDASTIQRVADGPRAGGPHRGRAPEPAWGLLPSVRDAVFRRLLGIADLAAAAGGLLVSGALRGHAAGLVAAVTVPAIVLLAKMTGRYHHDEVVLRKSTLDEIPALLGLAAAFALAWSAVAVLAGDQAHLHGSGVVLLCGSAALFLTAGRVAARGVAQSSAPRERVLIVGSAGAREQLAHSLASDAGAHLEVVGFLPLEDKRRPAVDWVGRARGAGARWASGTCRRSYASSRSTACF